MIPIPSARVIIAVIVLATMLSIPCRAAEKLPAHPKLVYRQIARGFTLALESNRREKTFFLCDASTMTCISTGEVGWRKPFIIIRDGGIIRRGYSVVDTSSNRSEGPVKEPLASYLETVPAYPAAGAWKKLSATKALW